MTTKDTLTHYDIVIIGGGPAGLSAALYAARSKKSVLVLEKETIGGQMMVTAVIENMPGGDNDPSVLAERMKEQAEHFGAVFRSAEVTAVDLAESPKRITLDEEVLEADAVILATGANPRKLGLENEEQYSGRGLGYCATCDGPFFAGLPIYVVGGGDAAKESGKIKVVLHTDVIALGGDTMLTSFVMRNNVTGEEKTVEGDFGLFIYIGMVPNTKLFADQIRVNEAGYIEAGEDTLTNLEGVYAAGDVRAKGVRQIVGALSDGATAAIAAGKYLDQLHH